MDSKIKIKTEHFNLDIRLNTAIIWYGYFIDLHRLAVNMSGGKQRISNLDKPLGKGRPEVKFFFFLLSLFSMKEGYIQSMLKALHLKINNIINKPVCLNRSRRMRDYYFFFVFLNEAIWIKYELSSNILINFYILLMVSLWIYLVI